MLFLIILVAIAVWMYRDAKARGEAQPALWAIGAALVAIVVVPVWLIKRGPKTDVASGVTQKGRTTPMKRTLKWVGLSMGLSVHALLLIGFLVPAETAARWKAENEAREAKQAAAARVQAAVATEAKKAAPSREKSGRISMENYLRLRTGMTVAEVEDILGGPGEEMSRVELAGVPTTVSYKWQRWTGANIILIFQGGRMNMKAQAGL